MDQIFREIRFWSPYFLKVLYTVLNVLLFVLNISLIIQVLNFIAC